MKLTRHNGRSGLNGVYNPRHNDRRFDVGNSEHIDKERTKYNIYWDCYRGLTTVNNRKDGNSPDFSFGQIEKAFYYQHYGDHVYAQNERNEKNRHPERNRSVEDLLANNKTCPEESIYQIGTIEESVLPETLLLIVNEFYGEFEKRFGAHIHILDWALHLDEGTPHIHERHVFDCENRYGEICPQQEKALEKLGIPLPDPNRPKSKNNNRKQTFDAVCRTMLFDIAKKHGLHLEQGPEYGGRKYLEKQDFIIAKQKKVLTEKNQELKKTEQKISEQEDKLEKTETEISQKEKTLKKQEEAIAEKEQELSDKQAKLTAVTMKISDVETLIDDVADTAYKKACEAVADTVRKETRKADMAVVEDYRKWVTSPDRKMPQEKKDFAGKCLDIVQEKLRKAAQAVMKKVQTSLQNTDIKTANTEQIKEKARESIRERLARGKEEADRLNREHLEQEGKRKPVMKKDKGRGEG